MLQCPSGRYTIGYGRNIDVASGKGITIEEAESLLANDITRIQNHLFRSFPVYGELNEVRQTVLVSMAYNMGMKGLMGFKKMLKAITVYDYETAADEMIDSKWARQVKRRAHELAHLMATGKVNAGI